MKTKKIILCFSIFLTSFGLAHAQWFTNGNALTGSEYMGPTAGSNVNPLVFKTGSGSAILERMRIIGTTGYVGIGTISPAKALHVVGSPRFDVNATGSGPGRLFLNRPAVTSYENLIAFQTNATNYDWVIGTIQSSLDFMIGRPTAPGRCFTILSSSGNVGIGDVTNPQAKLHVNGDITFGPDVNDQRWRFGAQAIPNGKLILQADNGGSADYTKSFTINPNTDYTSFSFGDQLNVLQTTIGKATGTPNYGTTYLGFNTIINNSTGHFERNGNGAANGGSVIWSNVDGELCFSSMKSSSGTTDFSLANDVYANRSMTIKQSATNVPQVLIGKDDLGFTNPHRDNYAIAVDGKLVAKEIYVTTTDWADYVFDNGYKLKSLTEIEDYISKNRHLPNVPSAAEISSNGNNLGNTEKILLEKIEELTLYLIQQNKKIEELEKKISSKE